MANGNTIIPHSEAEITLSKNLYDKAQHAFVFDDLKTCSSVSIGQLCDDDCIAIFFQTSIKNSKKQYSHYHGQP